jgi:hypothetical protein
MSVITDAAVKTKSLLAEAGNDPGQRMEVSKSAKSSQLEAPNEVPRTQLVIS